MRFFRFRIFPGSIRYTGVQPIAWDVETPNIDGRDRLKFLLGREHPEIGWEDSNKWSDFGGRPHPMDNLLDNAAREAWEESMGLLGSMEEIREAVKKSGKIVRIYAAPNVQTGVVFLMPIPYQPDLPHLFARVYDYFKRCTVKSERGFDYIPSCLEGFYEKTEIQWFTARQLFNAVNGRWNVLQDGPMPSFRPAYLHAFPKILEVARTVYPYT